MSDSYNPPYLVNWDMCSFLYYYPNLSSSPVFLSVTGEYVQSSVSSNSFTGIGVHSSLSFVPNREKNEIL